MTTVRRAAALRITALGLAISTSGCSVIGFVGGSGVDALRKHPPKSIAPRSLSELEDGASVKLNLLDSTSVEGRKLTTLPADYDTTAALGVLRVLVTGKGDSRRGDTLLVPIAQIGTATVPGKRAAARKAAEVGAKGDVVVLKSLLVLGLAIALVVGIFGLVLSGSGFSF